MRVLKLIRHKAFWWQFHRTDRRVGAILLALISVIAGCWLAIAIGEGLLIWFKGELGVGLTSSAQRSSAVGQPDARPASVSDLKVRDARSARPFDRLAQAAIGAELRLGVQTRRLVTTPAVQGADVAGRVSVVSVELRGRYANIKGWTAQMLATWPQALALKSLDLTRAEGDSPAAEEVTARAEFLFTTRPVLNE